MKTDNGFVIVDTADHEYFSLDKEVFHRVVTKAFIFHDREIAEIVREAWLDGFSPEWRDRLASDVIVIPFQRVQMNND